jgi:hypothetical protein
MELPSQMGPEFEFKATVWVHDGPAAWYFLTLPVELAEEIEDLAGEMNRPFGTLKVEARIGDAAWSTSIFKDTKRSSYLLPLKAPVRRKAGIGDGDEVTCRIALDAA